MCSPLVEHTGGLEENFTPLRRPTPASGAGAWDLAGRPVSCQLVGPAALGGLDLQRYPSP